MFKIPNLFKPLKLYKQLPQEWLPWKFKYLIQTFVSRSYLRLYSDRYLDLKRLKIAKIKPNLIIIGAQKAGTTSLHTYLSYHPEIFISRIKEPWLYLDAEEAKENGRVGNFYQVLKIILHGYQGETEIMNAKRT